MPTEQREYDLSQDVLCADEIIALFVARLRMDRSEVRCLTC